MYNLQQDYSKYTQEDLLVWKLLFQRQKVLLQNMASKEFFKGLDEMNFSEDKIADFNYVNQVLAKTTGWQIEVVPGLIPDKDFFELLADKKFPSSTWLRKLENLDYLEEPDMFHDCFAHMPLLTEQFFVDYLQALSKIALKHIDDALAIELIGRIYWFTVEFGLIKEKEGIRIYGAGILSSSGESIFCLSDKANRQPFDIKTIMGKHYYKDHFQDRYYVINSYKDLFDAIPEIDKLIENAVARIPHEKNIYATPLDFNL
ncbi:phenylalanine 4-monooxygenase [Ferruginibacter lapsinanis]|uniref:phenylalanine 4-monooxygenase n=1 Tax=Ferruginibacter lapsinanis TaxID=563172 RepID=UPI001E64BF28|nr:phenylalanine 4-monooxygenase [Ferruginibacter lapsinanis]UEG50765.1 phenylalanine 4-monooxygenase [Ferruginibacter lapsinanis]